MTRLSASLRGQWWLTGAAFLLATVGMAALLAFAVDRTTAARWLVAAAGPVGYALWALRRGLPANHPPEGVASDGAGRHQRLGLANGVTLARGWLYAGVAGFLLVPPIGKVQWLPALGYGLGAALDRLDGGLARTLGRPTELGRRLDLAFDTLGFLVAPLVAVAWGRLPVWYLSLSAARYLFKFGCWWRRRRGRPVGDLPASRLRRPLAGLQMAFLAVALVPVVFARLVALVAPVVLAPSLAVFARDYLVVAGHAGEPNGNESPAR
ncbi:CDP-alcohol phosphatidyltransferase family protein [Halosegnis sp.]|uniref:CDP-alcohol phosphatidyltransferase family protein n=1 Tax=Halosegnis sp. TaxID=2864959 RepID=UPI0035D45EF2